MPAANGNVRTPAAEAASWLKNLQLCRDELNASQSEVIALRKILDAIERRIQEVDSALASYTEKNKNPFKLLWSRMVQPGEMRKERKLIESRLKEITGEFRNLRTAREKKGFRNIPALAPDLSLETDPESLDFVPRHHAIISGTGRAGTTFLMQLLTALGLDTGFQHYTTLINQNAQAGLERDIREHDAPYIVKNPALCDYLGEVLEHGDVVIDHAFIPVRDLAEAARSRARVSSKVNGKTWGGYWDATGPEQQEVVLMQKLTQIIVTLAQYSVPVTLLSYPRLAREPRYLHEKLRPILGELPFADFEEFFRRVARPELVRSS